MEQKASFGGYLVGIYLFTVPVLSYSVEIGLNKIPQIAGVFLILFAVYDFARGRVLQNNKTVLLYFLFTIWCVTTYVFAEHRSETEGLFTLIKVTLITVGAAILIKNQSDFIVCLSFFFISVFITVLLNFEDIAALSTMDEITEGDRFAGTFANANTAALYCLAIIWTGFTLLFMRNRTFFLNIAILLGIILAAFIIIYTGSRKGLLGLGFFSIGLAWFLVKKYSYSTFLKFFIVLIILGGIFAVFYFIYTSPFFYRVQIMLKGESSSKARIYLFTKAIQVWSSSLKNLVIGVGADNFRYYNDLDAYSHSTVSETLVCSGIVGFGFYFASLFSLFSSYLKTFRKISSEAKISLIFVIIFLLLFFFFNMFSVILADRLFWPLIGVISSYGLVIRRSISNDEVNTTHT